MKRTNKKGFKILCLDPSLRAFGYAILQDNEVVTCGCIKTDTGYKKLRIRKGDDRMRRVSEINFKLKELFARHKIAFIVSELPHGSQSAVAAIALGLVSGAVQSMADFLNIGLEWFSEGDAKMNALGKRSASKGEMINRMSKLYEVPWTDTKYKDEAIADSLAIHYVARSQSAVLKALR